MSPPLKPVQLALGASDPIWLEQEANRIIDNVPITELGNASGKFFENYECWVLHHSSDLPLVRHFMTLLENAKNEFVEVFEREAKVEFITLSLVRSPSQQICVPHKDGYFFNGQFHLTILGNGGITVYEPDDSKIAIEHPNGTFWYLNGTEYFHEIAPIRARRIEVCAPCSPREDLLALRKRAFVSHPWKFANPFHPDWQEARNQAMTHIKEAVANGLASNLQIASFPDRFEELVRKDWLAKGFNPDAALTGKMLDELRTL